MHASIHKPTRAEWTHVPASHGFPALSALLIQEGEDWLQIHLEGVSEIEVRDVAQRISRLFEVSAKVRKMREDHDREMAFHAEYLDETNNYDNPEDALVGGPVHWTPEA